MGRFPAAKDLLPFHPRPRILEAAFSKYAERPNSCDWPCKQPVQRLKSIALQGLLIDTPDGRLYYYGLMDHHSFSATQADTEMARVLEKKISEWRE
ncbi:uncharacterized protein TrAtP1_004017 [Trichoderma atroviride]|uniref:uncharacterized protein n=1 Tax=Hypocrea atroviridis TaxID=63577 RepID=UPI0033239767|nr:hypothetical protein TrAtP1_004017 [Trichoderma atroviride]